MGAAGVIGLMDSTLKDSPNLDLLRSCAVAFVVISHLPYFMQIGLTGYDFKALGHVGVAVFFVHTSLVLMLSLERHGAAAGPFLIRRFFRIYPLSIAVVLLMSGLLWLGDRPLDLGSLASNLLLIQNITGHNSTPDPLWTLPYEVQMYLFLPSLSTVARSARPVLCVGLLCAASAALVTFYGVVLLQFVPCFLAGILAFIRRGSEQRLSPVVLFPIVAAAVLTIPTLVAAGVPEAPLLWGLCLILGLTIPACRQITSEPLSRCAKVVATYSYGIYLTHVLALGLAFSTSQRAGPLEWLVFCVLLPGLAWVAYHGIEKQGIRLGIRLANKLQPSGQRQLGATT
jgi:peptidoglycan/LPS O-acetylase OafA/YrhL